MLIGYTDQCVDPRTVVDPSDPRLDTYEGVLPGLRPVRRLPEIRFVTVDHVACLAGLRPRCDLARRAALGA